MTESLVISVSAEQIRTLDMTPLHDLRQRSAAALLELDDAVALQLDWPRSDDDPRELSEVPECRLWSLRADALCPWLTLLLQLREQVPRPQEFEDQLPPILVSTSLQNKT